MIAIVNVTSKVVATPTFRLGPGRYVWLTDYYRDEETARRDISLRRLLSNRCVAFREIDPAGLATRQRIEEIEQRDLAERAAAAKARKERRAEQRQSVRRAASPQVRQGLTARQAESEEAGSLMNLFEEQRKQRIAATIKVRDRQQEQAASVDEAIVGLSDDQLEQLLIAHDIDPRGFLTRDARLIAVDGLGLPAEVIDELLKETP